MRARSLELRLQLAQLALVCISPAGHSLLVSDALGCYEQGRIVRRQQEAAEHRRREVV